MTVPATNFPAAAAAAVAAAVVPNKNKTPSVTMGMAPPTALSAAAALAVPQIPVHRAAVPKPPASCSNTRSSSTKSKVGSKALSAGAAAAKLATGGNSSSSSNNSRAHSSGSSGENTGRWTAEEHRLFLQGLEQHGKGWKKIASLIKSRTVVQIRTHAQKYFQKLAKARQNGEEGEVPMEGRGHAHLPGHNSRNKKRLAGNKRKGISDVVRSAAKEESTWPPKVAPALVPYLPSHKQTLNNATATNRQQVSNSNNVPSSNQQHPDPLSATGTYEDSLYRFLTPSIETGSAAHLMQQQSNNSKDVNGTTTANSQNHSIILPHDLPCPLTNQAYNNGTGDDSPTCVSDLNFPFPFASKDPPNWFTKGADVEELLQEAGALDWLADAHNTSSTNEVDLCSTSGSETSNYNIPIGSTSSLATAPLPSNDAVPSGNVSNASIPALAGHNTDISIPNLFEHGTNSNNGNSKRLKQNSAASLNHNYPSVLSMSNLEALASDTPNVENFNVFDANIDEQAFFSALLDPSAE